MLIYAAQPDAQRQAALEAAHAEIVYKPGAGAKVDLLAMLSDLGARGINELHVEAGHKLNGSLVKAGLVDEYLIYFAPKLLGQGREIAAFGPLHSLGDAIALQWREFVPVGEDLRLLARPKRGTEFWAA